MYEHLESFDRDVAHRDALRIGGPPAEETRPGCGKRPPMEPHEYCEPCLGYQWGYDQAEQRLLESVIAGAVRGALKENIPNDKILLAVYHTLEAYDDENSQAQLDHFVGRRRAA